MGSCIIKLARVGNPAQEKTLEFPSTVVAEIFPQGDKIYTGVEIQEMALHGMGLCYDHLQEKLGQEKATLLTKLLAQYLTENGVVSLFSLGACFDTLEKKFDEEKSTLLANMLMSCQSGGVVEKFDLHREYRILSTNRYACAFRA